MKRAKLTKKQKIAMYKKTPLPKTLHYKTPRNSRNSRNSSNLVANFFRKLI